MTTWWSEPPFAAHDEVNEGLAFLFLGSGSGLAHEPVWHAEANHVQALLGWSVNGAGDLDGDGYDDVVVGAPRAEHGQNNEGVALVYYGGKNGLARKPGWTFDGDRTQGNMGQLVRAAGDINGDGVPDLLLGAIDCEQTVPRTRVVVVYGSRGGLQGSSGYRVNKPPLVVAQAWLDEGGWKWLGGLVAPLILGLVWALARLRRRLAGALEENRRLGAVRERARLARDIHDSLGADLTDLALRLEKTRQEPDLEAKERGLAGLSAYARQLLGTMRELVWTTNPECDTVDSVASFLSEQSAAFLQARGIKCELDFPMERDSRPVTPELRHHLLLMVKEALHNAVKHAGATCVEVSLRAEKSSLRLMVRDNGGGFDLERVNCNGTKSGAGFNGLGLGNLRARAAELGGSCEVRSRPGEGTTVQIRIPLGPDTPAIEKLVQPASQPKVG